MVLYFGINKYVFVFMYVCMYVDLAIDERRLDIQAGK